MEPPRTRAEPLVALHERQTGAHQSGNLSPVRAAREAARRHPMIAFAPRVLGSIVVTAGSLWAATFCVAVALVSPMYAFEGGSVGVALGMALAAAAAALAVVVGGGLIIYAIWHLDEVVAAAGRLRKSLRWHRRRS